MDYCDNCEADDRQTPAMLTLGDGLNLCADCWAEVKDDCEPIEP